MRRLHSISLATSLIAATLLAGCQAPAAPGKDTDASVRRIGRIDFKPCVLGGEQGQQTLEAFCARFDVAEDPAQPKGRHISLNIGLLPAEGKSGGAPDPVFLFAGGPGQSATQVAPIVSMQLREVNKSRDIVLVDQRGTGQSNPLDCRNDKGGPLEIDEAAEADQAALDAYIAQCLKSLHDRADTRLYTTTIAIGDFDAVRAAMGIDKINVVGVSYGTRVAQKYAAKYPQHTRSVVIDGVAPNRLVVGGEFAQRFEEALHNQDTQCGKVPACRARYGVDLVTRLRQLKERLAAAPVKVSYPDPRTNQLVEDTVTADTLVGLAHTTAYQPEASALLPLLVSEAEAGRPQALASVARLLRGNMSDTINRGMYWSVICAEDAPRYKPDPLDATTVLGADTGSQFFAACKQWPSGTLPADFAAPFTSTLPTLVLSGELDPVTPPMYGAEVAKNLRNGRHIVLRGQAHGTMGVGCMPKLVGQFLETADAKALDTKCLDSLGYVPPFTSFNGWEP
ncbi:alpha/beta hydrolase [Lysobacter fragariae]